jgi:tetratricopeptide (TPR) repeat protein
LLPSANPFLVEDICAYAGGNPLYIEELCHRVADGSTAQRLGRLQGGAAWLRVLIEARVTRLPPAQAALVRSAAVMGNVIPTWLFERITGCGADDEQVRALAMQDLIYPGEQEGTLRFKHGITRDVVYEAVGLHERKALHLQIAQALVEAQNRAPVAGENTFEALAYHFNAAGSPAEAAHHAELAGDKAVAASALDRAQAQYRAALAALDELEPSPERAQRWIAIMQRLGLVCVFDPSRDDLPLFERALELARSVGDATAIARAQYWLAYLHYALGHSLEAVRQAELALEAARACDDDRLFVQVEATLGQALAAAGRYAPALELLDSAIAVKQSHRSGAGLAVGLVYSLACKGYVVADRGDFSAARACFDEALGMVGAAQHEVGASIRGWYGAILLWQGRWQEARAIATEGCILGGRVRSLFSMSMGRAVAAYASWKLEPDEHALSDMLDTVAWLAPRGNGLFTSLNHGWLADAYASRGCVTEARLYAARALRRGRQHDLIGVAMACRAMARLAADAGDSLHARRWIERALKVAATRGSAHEHASTLLCSAEVELALGERRRASSLLDEAGAAFAQMGMEWHLDQVERLRRGLES